ncbi:MAG: phosphotransferase [Anaerolineales bacterium]|nr:phosphotransferase [Anaerolineales bacterium]
MEQEIRDRYNDSILRQAMQRFGIEADKIKLLDGFESYLYEFEKTGGSFILRIGHSRRRSPDLIRGEVDWINFLAAGGAGVAKAVTSAHGNLVEAIPDAKDGQFLATAFVKAKGSNPWDNGWWREELFVEYGRLLGKMHRLAQTYIVSNLAWQRPIWDAPNMLQVEKMLPASDTIVRSKYRTLMAHLQTLPTNRNAYGMIHQDAHSGNFFVDENGQITLFDFDDCVYGHFAYDIAMALFYAVTNHKDADTFAPQFWQPFWQGYCQENSLDNKWLHEIPRFLKLREIDLYAVIHRSFDVDNLTDSWVAAFMNGRFDRIANDVPYVNTDFLLR